MPPRLVPSATTITAAGDPPKRIDEFVGRVNTGTDSVSIARMASPPGWEEPGQRPAFDEWVRYSSPEGARYVAVCLPAFSPGTVHRDTP